MTVLEPITAVLFALASPTAEPVPFAVFFTDAGPAMCAAVEGEMNAQAEQPTDPRFYCDE